jgi:hypothetical protein
MMVGLVLWGFGTHSTHAGSGDEPHYLAIAHSIAFDGDLDVGNNYGAAEPLIMSGSLVPEAHRRHGVDGTYRPIHDVGLPLLIAPYVRLAAPLTSWLAAHVPAALLQRAKLTPTTLYRHVLSFAMIALASVLALLIFDVLIALGASLWTAFWFTLLLVASPPLLAYSTLLFTELLSALLAFLVFSRGFVHPAKASASWLALGVATGFLLLVHVRNVGLIVGLGLLVLWRLREFGNGRHVTAFVGGAVAMLGARTLINHHFWGTWLTTPHASAGEWHGWLDAMQVAGLRLVAMLIDQEYGLLVYAPVYVLALAGMPALVKTRPQVGLAIIVVSVSYLLPVLFPLTNPHGWSGQWCPAGRFLTPLLPLLGVAVYVAYSALRSPALIVIAVQIVLSAYFWQNPKLLWNDGDGRAAFCSRVGHTACQNLPSLATTVH